MLQYNHIKIIVYPTMYHRSSVSNLGISLRHPTNALFPVGILIIKSVATTVVNFMDVVQMSDFGMRLLTLHLI